MAGLNKVELIGRLGQDPESRFMPNGDAVANVSIATSETWKDKNSGERKEKTEWHRVVFFGKVAEIASQYLRKGSQCYVCGKLQTRKWQDQNGQDRYTTEIVVDSFDGKLLLLDGKPQGGNDSGDQAPPQRQQQSAPQPQRQPAPQQDFDDDIPF